MKFATLFILAGIGAILFAIFAGHEFSSPATSSAPKTSTAPSGTGRPSNYVNPLDAAPRRPPTFTTMPVDGSGNAASSSTDAAAVTSGPSLFSSVVSYLRQHLSSTPPPPHTTWTLDDLRIARGQAAEIHEGKVFFNCQAWNVYQAGDPRLHAGDGFSPSPILGLADSADELARYGTLKAVVRGSFVSSPYSPRLWTADRYLNGPVIVEDCPASIGQRVKIVVAFVGMVEWQGRQVPDFTAAVRLDDAQTAPGAWMWQSSGDGPLDKAPSLSR